MILKIVYVPMFYSISVKLFLRVVELCKNGSTLRGFNWITFKVVPSIFYFRAPIKMTFDKENWLFD